MDYIKSYVHEVGKRLPSKNREDIEKELSSILMDMVDDKIAVSGKPVNEDLIKGVLREYGSPDSVAARYQPERYLISPRMFPLFWMVLRIAVVVLLILLTVTFGIQIGTQAQTGTSWATIFAQYIGGIFQTLLQTFGTIALIFFLIEHFSKRRDIKSEFWDPGMLEEVKETTDYSRGDLIVSTVFTIIGLIVFSLFPKLVGLQFFENNVWITFDFFTQAFINLIPAFMVLMVFGLSLNMLVLYRGEWTYPTRIARILLDVANVVILIIMITGPVMFKLPSVILNNGIMTQETYLTVQNSFLTGMKVVLGIGVGGSIISIGKRIYYLINSVK